MEAALGWLGDLIRALLLIVPRLLLVRTTHAGVKFRHGCTVLELTHQNGVKGTGLHVYWPLVTECEVVPIKRQTTNLDAQYLCTQDNQTIGVSGILVYEIDNVVALLTETFDYEDTIRDLSLATVKSVVVQHDLDHLRTRANEIDKELTKDLRGQLRRFGVKTIRVTLSDLAPCRVVGHWGIGIDVTNNTSTR